ncbi:MAG: hypothetical protein C0467_05775 [Planctomycetaceae bacterium]|nr:hypothetical protein [Planctomycetaceae bacterium]
MAAAPLGRPLHGWCPMPTFFSDPPQIVYLVLAALLLLSGAVWANRRDRTSLKVFVGIVAVLTILLLLDRLFESPREDAVNRLQLMVKAADAKNPDAFVEHLADTVEMQTGGQSKTEKREAIKASPFWGLLKQFDVRVVGWDFSQLETTDANKVEIGFMAKGEAQGKPYPVYIRAMFTRQPDGKMKLTAFQSFNPVNRSEPIAIPYFP